jgi:cell division protein ZapA (FtsZ GTPase activity inhibitor)
MKIKEKLYEEKYLKKIATKINYKMREIKPSYCSEIALQQRGMIMAL